MRYSELLNGARAKSGHLTVRFASHSGYPRSGRVLHDQMLPICKARSPLDLCELCFPRTSQARHASRSFADVKSPAQFLLDEYGGWASAQIKATINMYRADFALYYGSCSSCAWTQAFERYWNKSLHAVSL